MQQLKTKTEFKETEIGLIPEEWMVKKLTDIGTLARGKSKHRPRDAAHLYDGKYPFIQTGEIKNSNHKIFNYSQTYSEHGLAQSKLWKIGTICITIAANIAETGILTFPACFPDSVIGFMADTNQCDIEFIEYLLQHYKKTVKSHIVGSVQDNINLGTFENIEFAIPPLSEQKSIAEILSSLDDKIELNRRMNKTLEEIGKALFKRWFVDFEFPNEDGKPYKSSGGKMVDSELGEIPEGWEILSLKDICKSITNGGTPLRSQSEFWDEGKIPWIKTGELFDTVIIKAEECINDLGLKSSATRLLPINSVIVAIYAAPTVGRLGVLKIPAATNQACTGLIADEGQISYLHLYYFLLLNRKYFNNISVGAAQQNISKQVIEDTLIAIPSDYRIIESSKDKFELLWNQIHSIHKENQILMSLRDSILPKLISGRIRTV